MAISSTPEELNDYALNLQRQDRSMPFNKRCILHAAMLAEETATSPNEFPELFQLSYKWIFDSGASRDFCGQIHVAQFAKHLRTVRDMKIGTAAGTVTMNKVMDIGVPWDRDCTRVMHVLPNTPPLISMGSAVESGFSFYWNSGFYPV